MLTIWGRINSHNVKKVVWGARECGLDFERHDMGGSFGYSSDYLAKNPNRLVPMIEDDGVVVWESNAILRYLFAAHAPQLWPADPAARAQGDQWMDWQFLYADAQRDAFLGCVRGGKDGSDPVVAKSAAACAELMAMLDAQLARQPFLSGDAFGVADVPMGTYAHTWFSLPIERPTLPHVEAWMARLRTRPGFQEIAAVPFT
ncbi:MULTISPECIES: glutathione S-transferase [unclassified Novosphingobium]|uniref:glutathione S-transferase family protein n=1 Tax=unclassified Novosphingobium TaxID=2644732 RepID=UPI00146E4B1E|nr:MULTISPECIES: glutathione S-transferase [unclassified Novosphingobium]NMN04061.1 glutathione S-transferase [Novosphingobium sp. SG919]NMN85949.1 glutathione S-transferase [Novosphingobium sp. SG916]